MASSAEAGERRIMFLEADDRSFLSRSLPLALALKAKGIRVGAALGRGEVRTEIEAAGIEYYPVRFRRGNLNPFLELATLWSVYQAYRDFAPHMVQQITFKPIVLGTMAARAAGVHQIVNKVTGLGFVFTGRGFKQRLLRPIAEAGYRSALRGKNTRVILLNPDDREYFLARVLVKPERAQFVLGEGVDPDRFAPTPEPAGVPSVLFPSRMLTDKGLPELIEAARMLKGEGVKFRLVLAGLPDPENPASCDEAQLQAWQEEGLAEWVGFQKDMPALLAAAHIVCLPSHREGLPVSLLEAASCGRPIVTTDAPGCREVVKDGHNGLVVPLRDPSALATALGRLIGDPTLRSEFGRNGRAMVLEQFSMEQMVSRTLALYEEVMGTGFLAS